MCLLRPVWPSAENCLVRLRAIGLLRDWPRAGMRDGQRKEKRVTPEEVKSEGKQPHVSATGRTLMYTPGFIAATSFASVLSITRLKPILYQ